jgi:undecaprenyl pyrophosphate synthase
MPADKPARRPHVAIIMDGNGRWATQSGWPRLVGHRKGAERVKQIVARLPRSGHQMADALCVLDRELEALDRRSAGSDGLFARYIEREADRMSADGVRMRFIGDRTRLDSRLQTLMDGIEARTAQQPAQPDHGHQLWRARRDSARHAGAGGAGGRRRAGPRRDRRGGDRRRRWIRATCPTPIW